MITTLTNVIVSYDLRLFELGTSSLAVHEAVVAEGKVSIGHRANHMIILTKFILVGRIDLYAL